MHCKSCPSHLARSRFNPLLHSSYGNRLSVLIPSVRRLRRIIGQFQEAYSWKIVLLIPRLKNLLEILVGNSVRLRDFVN